jgi:hypothetical protein
VAAAYSVGPNETFTPGALKADADILDGQVNFAEAAFEAHSSVTGVNASTDDGWNLFYAQWKAFYGDHFSGGILNWIENALDSTRDTLIAFETRYADLAAALNAQEGIDTGPGVVAPKPDAGPLGLGAIFSSAIVILVLILILIVKVAG